MDLDKGENGEVRYELIKGHGELFRVDRKTGDVTLKQMLEGHNKEYQLIIAAYDGGKKISICMIRNILNIGSFRVKSISF